MKHIHDPRVLALVLDDLLDRLRRWSILASDLSTSAARRQRDLRESLERSAIHSRHARFQLEQDEEETAAVKAGILELSARLSKALAAAHESLAMTGGLVGRAEAGLNHWNEEHAAAQEWHREALAWVQSAARELEEAKLREMMAKSDLNAAQSSLSSCRSSGYVDSEGRRHAPDCSSEEVAVKRAAERLDEARAEVAEAKLELQRARAEEERARARVECCEKAVRASIVAVELAQEGLEQARLAVDAAERSLEYQRAAEHVAEQAGKEFEAEAATVEECETVLADGEAAVAEAAVHSRMAEELEESAQRLAALARTDLEKMISNLLIHARADARLEGIPS